MYWKANNFLKGNLKENTFPRVVSLLNQFIMRVFFYGLFMDESILLKNDIAPTSSTKGYLKDYTLKIGNRASLIPCKNEKAYGLIMNIADEKIIKLYSEQSVADYIPEKVEIITELNERLSATCYNLPTALLAGTNTLYAKSLYDLAKKLDFPSEYLESISKYII